MKEKIRRKWKMISKVILTSDIVTFKKKIGDIEDRIQVLLNKNTDFSVRVHEGLELVKDF